MRTNGYWQDRRVLVGGGAGFLGSYLVAQLVEEGARPTVVDNFHTGSMEGLAALRDRVEIVRGDLRDPRFADEVTRGHEIFINMAAKAHGMDYSRAHNGEMLVDNLLCTLAPLDAARRNGVGHVVVVSSSCVYPDEAPVPTPELPVMLGTPESVNEGYGWAKRIQELAGAYYARDYGMKVTTVRPFNPYGGNYRWDSEAKAHVIPALVKRILDGADPLVVWGSGNQRRNFLHATDAMRFLLKVVEKAPGPEPVNIGLDDDVSIRDLVELICEVSGVYPKIVYDTTKPEGRFRKCADATRLRQVTGGLQPRVPLRDGIREMVDWYHRAFPKPSRGR